MDISKLSSTDYVTRVLPHVQDVPSDAWNALLAAQSVPTPFMRHEYLAAMDSSASACPATGWSPRAITLWQGDDLVAACMVYLKTHSYGEYVFDFAWANAYAQHGLQYYPKALIAPPFTPVPGSRLLARDAPARLALITAVQNWCEKEGISSAHMLFAAEEDLAAAASLGWMQRQTVQFHWKNAAPTLATTCAALPPEGALASKDGLSALVAPTLATAFTSFDAFLATLAQEKRKKIRQERRKVSEAGVVFRHARGADISQADWDFFYRCYERTYIEHGNAPYLSRSFFASMASGMAQDWLLFIGELESQPIASSLIALNDHMALTSASKTSKVAYGRYWGALARVDCLHFEACYYQPIDWCIANGFARFEGGAQGEHKMARALMPVQTHSAHWLAHPQFANAVERFLEREGAGINNYMQHLDARSPFRQS